MTPLSNSSRYPVPYLMIPRTGLKYFVSVPSGGISFLFSSSTLIVPSLQDGGSTSQLILS